jgi:hypothetical protein
MVFNSLEKFTNSESSHKILELFGIKLGERGDRGVLEWMPPGSCIISIYYIYCCDRRQAGNAVNLSLQLRIVAMGSHSFPRGKNILSKIAVKTAGLLFTEANIMSYFSSLYR